MPAEAAPGWLVLTSLPGIGEALTFDPRAQHYLHRVCRARPGEHVVATDGQGGVARVRLASSPQGFAGTVDSLERLERASTAWLLCGAPEGERADWMIEKLVELGVAVFQPVSCDRVAWGSAGRRLERWQRLASAALGQSRQPFQLDIRAPVSLTAAIAAVPSAASRWMADAAGPMASAFTCGTGVAAGAVGPAKGFSDAEASALRGAGFNPISLSRSRLRTETAALAWASWWAAASR